MSYNSTGFGPGKPEYVSKLIDNHDFVLLQEHWLRDSQFHRIRNIPYDGDTILSHDISAIDDSVFINGRGFGGCSILWKSSLKAQVYPIATSSKRICAVKVVMDSMCFIVYNVYMPCDSPNNLNEFVSTWDEILSTCDIVQCNNFIIGGDLNTSLDRSNSGFTQYLLNIVEREHLYLCINDNVSDIDFTFTSPVNHSNHTIDHFIVNSALSKYITAYKSLHDGDNMSFHSAVSLQIGRVLPMIIFLNMVKL